MHGDNNKKKRLISGGKSSSMLQMPKHLEIHNYTSTAPRTQPNTISDTQNFIRLKIGVIKLDLNFDSIYFWKYLLTALC